MGEEGEGVRPPRMVAAAAMGLMVLSGLVGVGASTRGGAAGVRSDIVRPSSSHSLRMLRSC